jgi:hypothetical protein
MNNMTRNQVEITSYRIQNYLEQISGQKLPLNLEATGSVYWPFALLFIQNDMINVQRLSACVNDPIPVYHDTRNPLILLLKNEPEPNQSIQDYLEQNFLYKPINYLL